jgi:putative transposase
MNDGSRNQRKFSTFNIIDSSNRGVLDIDMTVILLLVGRITLHLTQLAEYYGYPLNMFVTNGAKFTASTFINWARSHDITIDYIQSGNLYQNDYVERFNCMYHTKEGN